MAKTFKLRCLKLRSSLWSHVNHFKKIKIKIKAASIKVSETNIKASYLLTLGLKTLKRFGLIGVLQRDTQCSEWLSGLKIASGSERKSWCRSLWLVLSASACDKGCGTFLSYDNIFYVDPVLQKGCFPTFNSDRWCCHLPVECMYNYGGFSSPQIWIQVTI